MLFRSLDTSLQTREAMIVYLMDHIYLPQTIWKLLDQTFQLTEDRELLSQQFPENFLNYMYYYIENPEAVDQSLFQPIDEGHMAADDYIRNYLDVRRQINWRKLEGCSQKLDSLEAFGLYHPYADVERLRILAMALETFRENGQPQDGGDTAVIRSEAAASAASLEGGGGPDPLPGAQDEGLPARLARAARDGVARLLSQAPESVRKDEYVRLYCAYAQWAMGQKEEAGCLWQKILDHMPTHYMAKLGMARYRMDKKEYCEAKELLLQLLDKDNQDEEALELMKIGRAHV